MDGLQQAMLDWRVVGDREALLITTLVPIELPLHPAIESAAIDAAERRAERPDGLLLSAVNALDRRDLLLPDVLVRLNDSDRRMRQIASIARNVTAEADARRLADALDLAHHVDPAVAATWVSPLVQAALDAPVGWLGAIVLGHTDEDFALRFLARWSLELPKERGAVAASYGVCWYDDRGLPDSLRPPIERLISEHLDRLGAGAREEFVALVRRDYLTDALVPSWESLAGSDRGHQRRFGFFPGEEPVSLFEVALVFVVAGAVVAAGVAVGLVTFALAAVRGLGTRPADVTPEIYRDRRLKAKRPAKDEFPPDLAWPTYFRAQAGTDLRQVRAGSLQLSRSMFASWSDVFLRGRRGDVRRWWFVLLLPALWLLVLLVAALVVLVLDAVAHRRRGPGHGRRARSDPARGRRPARGGVPVDPAAGGRGVVPDVLLRQRAPRVPVSRVLHPAPGRTAGPAGSLPPALPVRDAAADDGAPGGLEAGRGLSALRGTAARGLGGGARRPGADLR